MTTTTKTSIGYDHGYALADNLGGDLTPQAWAEYTLALRDTQSEPRDAAGADYWASGAKCDREGYMADHVRGQFDRAAEIAAEVRS